MIQRAPRSRQDGQPTGPDSYPVTKARSQREETGAGALVKHMYSAMLTSGHVDVTDADVTYAAPKKFVFISKNRMKSIDANRWCRQATREAIIVPVEDITSENCSIDNRKAVTENFS